MTTTLGQINLFVADMTATVAFYRLLELDVADPYDWPEGSGAQHVDVHFGGDFYIAFDNHAMARIWNPQFDPDRGGGNAVIGLMVAGRADVDRLYDRPGPPGTRLGWRPTTRSSGPATPSSSTRTATRWASSRPSRPTGNTSQSSEGRLR
jgi:catechol 2,3-dioxygenase-like lactoylglutathione lyase family enzyme